MPASAFNTQYRPPGRAAPPAAAPTAPPAGFVILDWKPRPGGTLLGFADVRTASGLIFHDVGVHQRGTSRWCQPASKLQVDRDGRVLTEPNGKRKYSPVVTFVSNAHRDKFRDSVIAALLAHSPHILPPLDGEL